MDNVAKVVIIAHTPEPERLSASAAGISTTKGTALDIYNNNQEIEKTQRLIKNVLRLGHTTTIEHVCFTIAFENVSAFVEQFMIEFRLASFTIKSRRYVDFSQMGYYQPQMRFTGDVSENTRHLLSDLYNKHIQRLFSEYTFFEQQGIPREDARFILPYCYRSNFYCTVNARELQHIIYAALKGRGSRYLEINGIGLSLLKQVREIAPAIFGTVLQENRDDKEERLRQLLAEEDFAEILKERRKGLREKEISHDGEGHDNSNRTCCELLNYPENPEGLVAATALIKHTLCASDTAKRILKEKPELEDKLLEIVCEDGRKRELEQVSFTFRINGLTLAGLTHLVRHRLQSINVPSFTEFGLSREHVLPDSIVRKPELLQRYNYLWAEHAQVYHQFETAGVMKEDLVYLYLSGNMVDVVTTMNGRELFHFLRLRTCNRAQWEIRAVAVEMLRKLRQISPRLFKRFGPSCYVSGQCPEGKLSCGQKEEMVRQFS